ncbi:MAG: sugar transferase [Pseudomonadota bacterium]
MVQGKSTARRAKVLGYLTIVMGAHALANTVQLFLQNKFRLPSRSRLYRAYVKRGLDLIICVLLLPIVLPIFAIVYVILSVQSGPVFFGHRRIGRGGKPFDCWKFRTMAVDADARLQRLLASDPSARAEWETTRKLRDDPRITWIGSFLRQSSLDEIPQIWNVLKGEMSLVGPRPVVEDELALYGTHRRIYLAMRPGLTGLWQVSGRNDVGYATRVRLDADYFAGIGLLRDLQIIFKTPSAMLRRTGC